MSALLGCCVDRAYGCGCTEETCMQLPDGKTCGDCVHLRRCERIFGRKPTDTTCDFFPRLFALRILPDAVDGDAKASP